ncbi:MAG: hypothetical protein Q8M16_07165 [Pirellulaceae bacterium]|nr:hypothetical protein [Pirellulaceae bacterium]
MPPKKLNPLIAGQRQCRSIHRRAIVRMLAVYGVGFILGIWQLANAQEPNQLAQEQNWDRVEYRESHQDPVQTLQGIVVELQANQLELKSPNGGMRRIPRSKIVSVQLLNQPSLAKADQQAAAGKFEEARQGFEAVVRANVPHWMKRHAAARRIQCLRVLQQHRMAVADFVNLANDDPKQIPFEALPLVWTSPKVDALMEEQIKAWLASQNEWERLTGASLGLLHPPTSANSQAVLEAYAPLESSLTEFRPLEAIATAQLWRRPQSRSPQQLKQMQAQLDAFPAEVKAGALLVMGKLWKNSAEPKLAADAFLQLAALYPNQHDLVLLGLEAAYYTLRDMDRDDAARVGEWLIARHPNAAQTDEIRKELGL